MTVFNDNVFRLIWATHEVDENGDKVVGSEAVSPHPVAPYFLYSSAHRRWKRAKAEIQKYNQMYRSNPGDTQVVFSGWIEAASPKWSKV